MGQLYLFNSVGHQLKPDPKNEKCVREDAIQKLIDDPVDLWIDNRGERQLAFAQLRANWSGTTRAIDTYHAVYEADPDKSVIERFGPALDELENEGQSSEWNFIKDENEIPWEIGSTGGNTLQELGLTDREKLAVIKLLEDSQELRIGMKTTESAALTASSLYEEVENESGTTIVVSAKDVKYKSSVKSVDLFLKVGYNKNFYGLEDTQNKVVDQMGSLIDTVKSEFQDQIEEVIEGLVKNHKDNRETYQELSDRKEAIHNIDMKSAQPEVVLPEFQAKLEAGDCVQSRKRNSLAFEILDQKHVQELRDWTIQKLNSKQTDINQQTQSQLLEIIDQVTSADDETAARSLTLMIQRTEGEELTNTPTHTYPLVSEFNELYSALSSPEILSCPQSAEIRQTIRDRLSEATQNQLLEIIDQVTSADDETAARSLTLMIQRAEDEELTNTPTHTHPLVSEFNELYSALSSPEILSRSQSAEIRQTIRDRLSERKKKYVNDEVEHYECFFRKQIRHFETAKSLEQAQKAIKTLTSREEAPSVTSDFDQALQELEENTILEKSHKMKIKRHFRASLEKRQSELRENEKSKQSQQLKQALRSLRRETEFKTEFERLCMAQLVLRGDGLGGAHSISNFSDHLDRIEDHPALRETDIREIKLDAQETIETMLDEVRDSKANRLKSEIERQLKNVPNQNEDLESAIRSLRKLRKHCQLPQSEINTQDRDSDPQWEQQITDEIDRIQNDEFKQDSESIPVFRQERKSSLCSDIADKITDRIETLRQEKQNEMKNRLSNALNHLVETDAAPARERLQIVQIAQSKLEPILSHPDSSRLSDQNARKESLDQAHESTQIAQPKSTLSECLDLLAGSKSPVWLDDKYKQSLAKEYQAELERVSTTLEDRVVEELVQQIRCTIKPEYLNPAKETSRLFDHVDSLDQTISNPQKLNVLRGVDDRPELIDGFERLPQDKRKEVINQVVNWTEHKARDISKDEYRQLLGEFASQEANKNDKQRLNQNGSRPTSQHQDELGQQR